MHTRPLSSLLLLLALTCTSSAHVELSVCPGVDLSEPALTVRVDPRVELMSIIFRLAGNREYNMGRVPSYLEAIDEHFGPHREHEAVQMAAGLRRTRGVSYDAVMSMAIHLTDAFELEELVPFDGENVQLDERWGADNARAFIEKARGFVEDTDFAGFLEKQRPLHERAQQRMQAMVDQHADLDWFDQFFGAAPVADFTVAIGLNNGGGNYGPKLVRPDGSESLYAVMGVWMLDDAGEPVFDERVLPTLVHEFCHSYANHLIEAHRDALREAGEQIFPTVEAAMRRQAYGNWETMLKESLVRASVVRYIHDHDGEEAALREITVQEEMRGFTWTGPLAELLGEYDADRETYGALSDFMPRVVEFFQKLGPRIAHMAKMREQAQNRSRPTVVSILPENGVQDVDPATDRIVITFDRPMVRGNYSVMLSERGREHFPEVIDVPGLDESGTVFTMRVKLKPDWEYEFQLNSEDGGAFQSVEGGRLKMVRVRFRTASEEHKPGATIGRFGPSGDGCIMSARLD